MANPASSERTLKWLWLIGLLFAWPSIFQLLGLISGLTQIVNVPQLDSIYVDVAVLTGIGWLLARFALAHGAPASIWIPMLLGTSPYAALALSSVVATHVYYPSAGVIAAALLPPLAAFIEARRYGRHQSVEVLNGA